MKHEYLIPDNLEEFWIIVGSVTGLIGILLIIAQLFYVARQINKAQDQIKLGQASETANIFFEVMDRWNANYEGRNKLLKKSPPTLKELGARYSDDPAELLNSEEWREEIRPILNFFEFLGVMLSNTVFDREAIKERIFTLVTVDTYPDVTGIPKDKDALIAKGTMYRHLKPYLDFLRTETNYRSDIYRYYDEVLLNIYADHVIDLRRQNEALLRKRA
ncbi:hypothetical protein DZK27_06695 [Rhodobacteraceae bacterium 63075]|nr:hypothetical protein DZK27_06695 [Rhodobacteraceae bacterium 63075]